MKEEPAVLTAEQVASEHPDWVTAWRTEGATQERERIAAIERVPAAGHDALVVAAKKDPSITADVLARQILEAERAQRDAKLQGLKGDEEKLEKPAPAPRGTEEPPTGRAAGKAIAQRYHELTTTTARN